MLSFFRTNQASAGLLLFFYALLLQLPILFGWVAVPALPSTGSLASYWLLEWADRHFYLATLLPVLLVTGQGIVANTLVTRHRMSRKVTQFPGLFIILCWALVPAFRALHPTQVAGFFLLLGLLSMGRIYKKEEPAVPLFNTGAWLGLAVLFAPAYLFVLPAFIIGIGILRRPDFRSMLQFLAGPLVVFFLFFSGTYFYGLSGDALSRQFSDFGLLPPPTFEPLQLTGLVVLALLLLYAIGSYGNLVRLLNIEGKKNGNLLIWVLLFLALSILASGAAGIPYYQVITVPVGLLIGLRFILFPEARAEFYHLVLFTVAMGATIWSVFT